jgi:dipeptidyl aminopeptidase/acylaminoacyl peptidase
MKPKDFDASKKYPVFMYQYSGPGSPSSQSMEFKMTTGL